MGEERRAGSGGRRRMASWEDGGRAVSGRSGGGIALTGTASASPNAGPAAVQRPIRTSRSREAGRARERPTS